MSSYEYSSELIGTLLHGLARAAQTGYRCVEIDYSIMPVRPSDFYNIIRMFSDGQTKVSFCGEKVKVELFEAAK